MPPRARKTAVKPSQADGNPTIDEVESAVDVLEATDAELDELALVDDEDNPIPEELQFTTKGRTTPVRDKSDAEVLSVDDVELIAFRPEPAAWNLLIGAMSKSSNAADKAHAVWRLITHVFDDGSLMYIEDRLMAAGDDFDQAILEKIVLALIDRWTPQLNRAQRRKAAERSRR
ncbi:hypothetical protein ACMTN4_07565 [Rhodococcus globerulus]|uniref:hypothetical protein n=1 Tax=Rhodococcus globerulus TaxID=33008 RepID=UPI0039EA4C84